VVGGPDAGRQGGNKSIRSDTGVYPNGFKRRRAFKLRAQVLIDHLLPLVPMEIGEAERLGAEVHILRPAPFPLAPNRRFFLTSGLFVGLTPPPVCSHNDHKGDVVVRKTVGSRELKTRLGTYLRQVQRGTTIVVTDRGQPVAELRPLDLEARGEEVRLAELTALGLLTRQSPELLTPFRPIRSTGPSMAAAISEGREDRV